MGGKRRIIEYKHLLVITCICFFLLLSVTLIVSHAASDPVTVNVRYWDDSGSSVLYEDSLSLTPVGVASGVVRLDIPLSTHSSLSDFTPVDVNSGIAVQEPSFSGSNIVLYVPEGSDWIYVEVTMAADSSVADYSLMYMLYTNDGKSLGLAQGFPKLYTANYNGVNNNIPFTDGVYVPYSLVGYSSTISSSRSVYTLDRVEVSGNGYVTALTELGTITPSTTLVGGREYTQVNVILQPHDYVNRTDLTLLLYYRETKVGTLDEQGLSEVEWANLLTTYTVTIASTPVVISSSFLNFELFGINFLGLFSAFITIVLFIFVVGFFASKKGG